MNYEAFNLIDLPIAVVECASLEPLHINTAMGKLLGLTESAESPETKQILNQILTLDKELSEQGLPHCWTNELKLGRRKKAYRFSAYTHTQDSHLMVIHGEDITKQQKTQYMLDSYSSLIEKHSKEMYLLAHTDYLTKAANRRALFDKYQSLTENKDFDCTISILDIDHFKEFNDQYGHEFGDFVLRTFSDHIRQVLPETAFWARIGGEEFCVIQERSNRIESTQDITHLLQSIKDIQLNVPGNHCAEISFSAGVAEYGKDGTSLDELLNNADKALYYAKANGRACVIPFSTDLFEKRDLSLIAKTNHDVER